MSVSRITKFDGTRLIEDHIKDLRNPLTAARVPAAAGPTWTKFRDDGAASTGVWAWAFSAGTENNLYFVAQMQHDWEPESPVEAHVHWTPSDGNAGTVRWGLEYTLSSIGSAYGNTAIIYVNAEATGDRVETLSNFPIIDMTGVTLPSCEFVCRIFRDATHLDDDYGNVAFGLEVDFHYNALRFGSRTTTSY